MKKLVTFKFRLYVADHSQNSIKARTNLDAICQSHLAGRHEIEVIDVFRDPQRALADGVLMTPTLVKFSPAPVRTIVGTLTQTATVLMALELEPRAT